MPPEDIDALEQIYPGITLKTVTKVSGMYDARLRKRYEAPFASPYPDPLVFNVSRETAWRLWLKRGFNPSGAIDQLLEKEHLEAEAWVKEAADSETGLVELPVRQATPAEASAINAGGPLGYSETSPYAWTTLQRETATDEDV